MWPHWTPKSKLKYSYTPTLPTSCTETMEQCCKKKQCKIVIQNRQDVTFYLHLVCILLDKLDCKWLISLRKIYFLLVGKWTLWVHVNCVLIAIVWLLCFASEIYNVNYTLNGHLWCHIIEKAFYLFSFSCVDLWSCTSNCKSHVSTWRMQLRIESRPILFNTDQCHHLRHSKYIHLLKHVNKVK